MGAGRNMLCGEGGLGRNILYRENGLGRNMLCGKNELLCNILYRENRLRYGDLPLSIEFYEIRKAMNFAD